jgi:hypothetical protein
VRAELDAHDKYEAPPTRKTEGLTREEAVEALRRGCKVQDSEECPWHLFTPPDGDEVFLYAAPGIAGCDHRESERWRIVDSEETPEPIELGEKLREYVGAATWSVSQSIALEEIVKLTLARAVELVRKGK